MASRAGSGQVERFSNHAGWVKLGQEFFKSHGSGRLGSRASKISRVRSGQVRGFPNIAGRIGSDKDVSKHSRVGSGQLTRLDPTRPVRFDLTRKQPWKILPHPQRGMTPTVLLSRLQPSRVALPV